MSLATILSSLALLSLVVAQQQGTSRAEVHPPIPWQQCTVPGSCTTQTGQIVLDANQRWIHTNGGYTDCYTGNAWDVTICPDPATCANACALDGVDYSTYGISTYGPSLTLKFVTPVLNSSPNIGSRTFLMETATQYQVFRPLNQELAFDVDVSQLPCGLNGALYFVEMDADGGKARNPTNRAGAKYGTGYCDSHCPQDLKFINGQANIPWVTTSTTTGKGIIGSCCGEVDVWQANSISTSFAAHPCSIPRPTGCTGQACGVPDPTAGICDPSGCDFNPYRLGAKDFYGPGKTVDTTRKFTVITQFITNDGTATGTLSEIRRIYVQNGATISNPAVVIPNTNTAYSSITSNFCSAERSWFQDPTTFSDMGGLQTVGQSLARGVVMVFSITEDQVGSAQWPNNMLWLDGPYPFGANTTAPGVLRGICSATSGTRAYLEAGAPNSQVVFSNIKIGPIGSFSPPPPVTSSTTTTTSSSTTSQVMTSTTTTVPTAPEWAQCGGLAYSGPTVCASPYVCVYMNDYYSECLASGASA